VAVMVTGVGFVGGYAVRELLARGEEVVIYGYLGGAGDPDGELPELEYVDYLIGGGAKDRVKVVVGDVGDLDAMTRAAEQHGVRSVLHFASLLPATAEALPWLSGHVNVMGTANVFETAARLEMDKVVWCSSSSVFGPRSIGTDGLVNDDSVFDPTFSYGAAKLMDETLARAYSAKYGLNISGVRPMRVYGFGEHVKLSRGGGSSWLAGLIYTPAVGGESKPVPFGHRSIGMVYVEDLIRAMLTAREFVEPEGADNYLIDGDYRRVRDIADYVRTLLPDAVIEVEDVDPPLARGGTLNFELHTDSSKAAAAFGYKPRFSMEAGVYRTLNDNRIYAGLPALPEPPAARVAEDS
jgi:nucleoside-diphosphate-sugar epimerase